MSSNFMFNCVKVADSLVSLGKKDISVTCLSCTLWESSMLQVTHFISIESMAGKYRETVVLILSTVLG